MRRSFARAPRRAIVLCLCATAASVCAAAAESVPVHRIVSLAPNLTELTYSAGAGDRLVGADVYSDYPEEARKLPRIGDAFQVDYERLLALRPDLVLVWDTGTPETVIDRLGSLGLRTERVQTSRLEDIARAVERIGTLAGTEARAHTAASQFLREVAELREQIPKGEPLGVFYQISEKPLYTVNGSHLISEIIGLCGGRNVFADLTQLAPAVGLEAVLARNPEVIITADGAQGDPLGVWRHWPKLRAVELGNLYTVHADHVARATPRVVEGVREVCGALDQARRKHARGKP
jgi:iron complex transport system substrate-binding protein